jgi:molybdopterin/thiamine biosynthesis adenylyltransferase
MFSRLLKALDVAKLNRSKVMVIGIGGAMGFAESLVRSGIGTMIPVDPDTVEVSNIGRQGHERIGVPKVISAKDRLQSINPNLEVITIQARFSRDNSEVVELAKECDLVVFATDSFQAQADGNWLVMTTGVPGLWIGLGENGECGEVVWYIPGYHENCMRCLLVQRFLSWENGDDPTSEGALHSDLQIVDGTACHLALGILTRGSDNYFGRLIENLGDRQFLQISLRSTFEINGSNPIQRKLGIDDENPAHFAYCTRFESNGRRMLPCPDCAEFLGRTFASNEFAACSEISGNTSSVEETRLRKERSNKQENERG